MNKGFPNSYERSSVEQNVRDESTDLQIKKLTDPTSSVEDLLSVMNQKTLFQILPGSIVGVLNPNIIVYIDLFKLLLLMLMKKVFHRLIYECSF